MPSNLLCLNLNTLTTYFTSEEPWYLIYAGQVTDPLQPSGTEIFFAMDGSLNTYGYSNQQVDVLFRKARSKEALDKDARIKIYAELSKIISDDQPLDFLASVTISLSGWTNSCFEILMSFIAFS